MPDTYEDISFHVVDILCSIDGKRIIYTGELFDYYIDGNGDLEAIHIRYPMRKDFDCSADLQHHQNKYIEISSRFLIIPNSNIANINIRYINLEELSEAELSNINIEEILDYDNEEE